MVRRVGPGRAAWPGGAVRAGRVRPDRLAIDVRDGRCGAPRLGQVRIAAREVGRVRPIKTCSGLPQRTAPRLPVPGVVLHLDASAGADEPSPDVVNVLPGWQLPGRQARSLPPPASATPHEHRCATEVRSPFARDREGLATTTIEPITYPGRQYKSLTYVLYLSVELRHRIYVWRSTPRRNPGDRTTRHPPGSPQARQRPQSIAKADDDPQPSDATKELGL